ncbi:MAG: hypothetical protein ACM359_10310 [Bacillota bacterium]
MSPLQKLAWYNLSIGVLIVVLYAVAAPLLGPEAALGVTGLGGFWGIGGRLCYGTWRGEVRHDEREALVQKNAALAAWAASWLYFVLICMVPWALMHYVWHQDRISVEVLPWILMGGFIVFMLAQSVAVLAQLGWRSQDA